MKRDFIENDSMHFLHQILSLERCNMALLSVKAILDCSLTQSIFKFEGNDLTFKDSSNTFIHNPTGLLLLLMCWKSLKKQKLADQARSDLDCNNCLEVAIKSFCLLLKDDHHYSGHNLDIFKQLHIPRTLVYSLLSEDAESRTRMDRIQDFIGQIFGAIVGSPPERQVIVDMTSALLLLHDHKLAFVPHSKASFPFHLQTNVPSEDEPARIEASAPGEDPHTILEHPEPWGEEVGDAKPQAESSSGRRCNRLISSLLTTLQGALQNMADRQVEEILTEVVHPQVVVVLCNNEDGEVREKCVRVLWQFVKRSAVLKKKKDFHFADVFSLLANSLHCYTNVTEGLVNACLSIVHDGDFQLQDHVEIPNHSSVSIRASGLVLLLALLPSSIDNVALAHNLIIHLHELCSKVPGVLGHLWSWGLPEILCKTIAKLTQGEKCVTDVVGQDSRDILFQDLHNFLRLIALRHSLAHGAENFSKLSELIQLLISCCHPNQWSSTWIAVPRPVSFSSATCVVFEEALSDIRARLMQLDHPLDTNDGRVVSDIYGSLFYFPVEEVTDLLLSRNQHAGMSISSSESNSASGNASFLRSWDKTFKEASRSELCQRMVLLAEMATDFVVNSGDDFDDEATDSLAATLLSSFFPELRLTCGDTSRKRRIVFADQGKLRKWLLSLVNHALSPSFPIEKRMRVLRTVGQQFHTPSMLVCLFKNAPGLLQAFRTYLREIVMFQLEQLSSGDRELCLVTLSALKGVVEETNADENGTDTINFHLGKLKVKRDQMKRDYVTSSTQSVTESNFRKAHQELLISRVSKSALDVTHDIVLRLQSQERKRFIYFLRTQFATSVKTRERWQHLIEALTHERAIWHFPAKWPTTFALAEIESQFRTRIRMERRRLNLEQKRFLHKDQSPERNVHPPRPFECLLKENSSRMNGVIIEQLASNDKIRLIEKARLIVPEEEIEGELLLSDSILSFVPTDKQDGSSVQDTLSWEVHEILEIHKRRSVVER